MIPDGSTQYHIPKSNEASQSNSNKGQKSMLITHHVCNQTKPYCGKPPKSTITIFVRERASARDRKSIN